MTKYRPHKKKKSGKMMMIKNLNLRIKEEIIIIKLNLKPPGQLGITEVTELELSDEIIIMRGISMTKMKTNNKISYLI